MAHDQIRLDDLLDRDVSVRWFEGVALVQALCRELSARSGSDGIFPGASQITLASDGTVTIGGVAATRAVPAAAHLLARMLSDDAPVRLRLVVTQATAEGAGSASLHEFSESLAYFERPNPEGILSALHARAAVAPPSHRQDAAEVAEPVAARTAPPASAEPRTRKPGRPVLRATAAVLLLAITALFARAGSRSGHLASMVEGFKSAVAAPAEATTTAVPQSPADGSRGKRPKAPRAGETTAAGAAAMGPRRSAVPVVSASAITIPFTFRAPPRIVIAQPVFEDVPAAHAFYDIEATALDGSDTIYSPGDASVTPPRQVYPALPASPSPGTRPEDLTVLELVVAADGRVEHVRLRTPPRDVHEFMLVSAAKAWRFDPATVDGRPVRYRHRVAITSSD